VLVAAGGILVHGDVHPLAIEAHVQHAVDRYGGGTGIWKPGFSPTIPVVIVAAVIGLLVWTVSRRWWRAVAGCAAVPLAVLAAELVLKPLVDRRDPGSGLLYPSGHLTGLAASATVVFLLVAPRLRRPRERRGLGVGCGLVCVGGWLAAVAGHAHGPLDALAGLATGAALALAWVLAVDAVADAAAGRRGRRADGPSAARLTVGCSATR